MEHRYTIGTVPGLGKRDFLPLPNAAAQIGDRPRGTSRTKVACPNIVVGTAFRGAAAKDHTYPHDSQIDSQARLRKDSAWCDSESRVMQDFRGRRAPSGNGVVAQGHDHRGSGETSARMNVRKRWNGWKRKKREAQAEPTFPDYPAVPEPSGNGTAKGNRNGSNAGKGTRIGSYRSRKISMEVRSGNRAKPQGIDRNPRNRPGPKGSGRNLPREAPLPSPAQDVTLGKWGLVATPAPISISGTLRPPLAGHLPPLPRQAVCFPGPRQVDAANPNSRLDQLTTA